MEAVILAYQGEQERRLGQTERRLEIIAGADEIFFDQVVLVMMDLVSGYLVLEEAADNRTDGSIFYFFIFSQALFFGFEAHPVSSSDRPFPF